MTEDENVRGMDFGDMRLAWSIGNGTIVRQTFKCLEDALEQATKAYMEGATLIRLTNWLGENACPPEQLTPIAQMRAKERRINSDQAAMENNPAYGAFG